MHLVPDVHRSCNSKAHFQQDICAPLIANFFLAALQHFSIDTVHKRFYNSIRYVGPPFSVQYVFSSILIG